MSVGADEVEVWRREPGDADFPAKIRECGHFRFRSVVTHGLSSSDTTTILSLAGESPSDGPDRRPTRRRWQWSGHSLVTPNAESICLDHAKTVLFGPIPPKNRTYDQLIPPPQIRDELFASSPMKSIGNWWAV